MEVNEGMATEATEAAEEHRKPQGQARKRKASRAAAKAPSMQVADVQALLRALLETDEETADKVTERLEESGIAYLTREGRIFAVCLSASDYDRLLRR